MLEAKKEKEHQKTLKMQRGKKDLGIFQKFNEVKVTVSEGYNDLKAGDEGRYQKIKDL